MTIEWVAATDLFTCENCGKNIKPGETVVGDVDRFFHKDPDSCD